MMPLGEQPFGEWLTLRHAHAHAGICLAKNKIKNASHIKHGNDKLATTVFTIEP